MGTGTHLNPFDTVSVEHMTRNEQIAFKVDAMLAQAGASAAEACPDCGTTAVFEEEELLEGEPKCPNCGKPLDFEVTEE